MAVSKDPGRHVSRSWADRRGVSWLHILRGGWNEYRKGVQHDWASESELWDRPKTVDQIAIIGAERKGSIHWLGGLPCIRCGFPNPVCGGGIADGFIVLLERTFAQVVILYGVS